MAAQLLLTTLTLMVVTVAKQCIDITIPTTIDVRQAIFDQDAITDNWVATQFALNFTSTRNGGNYTDQVLAGYQTITGQYNISATFCHPDAGVPADSTVQILIHGIGFDRTYWDLPSFSGISTSYTDTAVDAYNFCTLAIDRFGIAGSYTPGLDPINLVQAPASMSIIYAITHQLRAGTVPDIPSAFAKIVHVGHSFGSFLAYFLVTLYPEASDGLVLTGFTFSGDWFFRTIAGFNLHVAFLNQPLRFGNVRLFGTTQPTSGFPFPPLAFSDLPAFITDLLGLLFPTSTGVLQSTVYQAFATTELLDLTNGYNTTSESFTPPVSSLGQNLPASYLTWSDLTANIFAFLYPPFFTADAALYAEKTKQPVTVGELLTIGNAAASADNYSAPVLMITGRQDNIYCGGDCTAAAAAGVPFPDLVAAGALAFPEAVAVGDFQSKVVEDMGHGMNFHVGAYGYFTTVQEFLVAKGLGNE